MTTFVHLHADRGSSCLLANNRHRIMAVLPDGVRADTHAARIPWPTQDRVHVPNWSVDHACDTESVNG